MDIMLAGWVGLCLGSFLNVVAHRLPLEESLWKPRSRCPRCGKMIRCYDNIPVLSFIFLLGRCRSCRARISWRYPAVELAMGIIAVGLWRRWSGEPVWACLAILAAGALLAVTLIDWDTMIIPDELSVGLLVAGLLAAPLNPHLAPVLMGPAWLGRELGALLGAGLGLVICWGTAEAGERMFGREALGGGDFKLLSAVGAWTGALGAFDCMFVGSLLGSVYGVAMIAAGRLKRYQPMPFGPFLSGAALFNLFYLLPFGFPFL